MALIYDRLWGFLGDFFADCHAGIRPGALQRRHDRVQPLGHQQCCNLDAADDCFPQRVPPRSEMVFQQRRHPGPAPANSRDRTHRAPQQTGWLPRAHQCGARIKIWRVQYLRRLPANYPHSIDRPGCRPLSQRAGSQRAAQGCGDRSSGEGGVVRAGRKCDWRIYRNSGYPLQGGRHFRIKWGG